MKENIQYIETLSQFKKEMKQFIRGVVKSKLFIPCDGQKYIFVVSKEQDKSIQQNLVSIIICQGCFEASMVASVSTRVFNKVQTELFEPIIEQMGRLKGFPGMQIIFEQVD
jgi:hypothetical protein